MRKLDFTKKYVLENDFVRLSPLRLEHNRVLLEISKDPNIWTYFLEKGNGIDNLTKYISTAVNNRTLKREYPFIVFDKLKKQYAGTTRFYDYSKKMNSLKLGHTWYGMPFRGTGLNKQCKYLLFEFAFETIKVERIGFGAYADNQISIAALKSVGCKKEGVLRSIFPAIDGKGRTDAVLMSILKQEWKGHVKFELQNKLNTKLKIN